MNHSLSTAATVALLAPLAALLLVLFGYPLGLVAWTSLHVDGTLTFKAFQELAGSTLFYRVLGNTVQISAIATAVSLVAGYIIALHLAGMDPRRRTPYMVLVMLPFWTSILVKSFAFTIVLGENGVFNHAISALFGRPVKFELLFNRVGVVIGMANYLLPFTVLPILASLLAQNRSLHRVAEIMGAGPVRIFLRITLPLSMPGVLAALLMAMTLSMGMYITPALLGGRKDLMMANLVDIYTRQTLNWSAASAIAIVLLLMSGILIALLMRVRRGEGALA
jgi:mannopine transport system permease protein